MTQKKLTAVQIGLGPRGLAQINGFFDNPDYFDLIGICDLDTARLEKTAKDLNIDENKCFADANAMLEALKPDVMAFATMPDVRKNIIELGIKHNVKGIMFEKPIANTLEEARSIMELCNINDIKTVVCHQHKYLDSFLKLREILDSGELGEVYQINASCQATAAWLGTHYIDYILWANNNFKANSVVAHIHGNNFLETDSHPAPAVLMGEIAMENGVRAFVECGYFSKPHLEHKVGFPDRFMTIEFWTDDRLTVHGTKGYAWAECDGSWAAFTSHTGGKIITGTTQKFVQNTSAMKNYTKDMALWMNGEADTHPCNINTAYHGFEILEGMYISALENVRCDLPLTMADGYDVFAAMKSNLKDTDLIVVE